MPDLFTVFNYAATPGGSLVKLCFKFGATTFITFMILQKKKDQEGKVTDPETEIRQFRWNYGLDSPPRTFREIPR